MPDFQNGGIAEEIEEAAVSKEHTCDARTRKGNSSEHVYQAAMSGNGQNPSDQYSNASLSRQELSLLKFLFTPGDSLQESDGSNRFLAGISDRILDL